MVKLKIELHHSFVSCEQNVLWVEILVMGLHHRSLKVEEFMMELYHKRSKKDEANIKASLWKLTHPCELMNGRLYKTD